MSFTAKQVKAILSNYGVSLENLDVAAEEICGRHKADLDGIKEERDELQGKLDAITQSKTSPTDSEEYKALQKKFDDEKAAHDKLRNGIAEKQTREARIKAIRAYYESKNIKGANLEIAMESADKMIGVTEFDENNQITSSTALDELVSGKFSGLVTHEHATGAQTATPPTGYGTGANSKSTGRAKLLAQQYQENNYGVPKTQNSSKEE